MRIGLDFDNTIVCYDEAIALLAEKIFDLPKDVPLTKIGVRNHLRGAGREAEWTSFQGELYGPGMQHARPFDGAIATMQKLLDGGHELLIISHRSRRPFAGPPHDLHAAAISWIADNLQNSGLFCSREERDSVHFLESRSKKLEMIRHTACNFFLDDLPEVLEADMFPTDTYGILFDPSGVCTSDKRRFTAVVTGWDKLQEVLLDK